VGWRAVSQMKNVNFWWAAQKTEGQAGGLHKKAVQQAIEKGGMGCRKGQPSLFHSPA